jgi:glutamate/tyrosine decarboxylase-like PLP-dependent enzyme
MNKLFPPEQERHAIDTHLSMRLAASRIHVIQGSVIPTFDRGIFAEQLALINFERPLDLNQLLTWTIEQMETGLVHITHPRYFGLFNPTPTFPAQCADRIAAIFNPQLATSTTSPAAVAIEAHVIRALVERFGLPAGSTGHFTTGGAEANYTALLLALTRACPEFAHEGASAFKARPTIYMSADSHMAWLKIAHQAGIGRRAVRLIQTDGTGRMSHQTLLETVDSDVAAGRHPVMIVATAGTTNAGMIDPLHACALIARSRNVWFHVDAAWGGAAIMSEAHRYCLGGIEDADSITVDAHKWFAATMGCGMLLCRWPESLATTFQVSTTYMPSNLGSDPYGTTVQWSRRFLGLRLFLSLAAAGWQGYANHVERTLSLANQLRDQLVARGWRVRNQSLLGVLCIDAPSNTTAEEIVRLVLASGKAWVSVACFEGHKVIRACVTSGETTENDIAALADCLEEVNGHYDPARVSQTN